MKVTRRSAGLITYYLPVTSKRVRLLCLRAAICAAARHSTVYCRCRCHHKARELFGERRGSRGFVVQQLWSPGGLSKRCAKSFWRLSYAASQHPFELWRLCGNGFAKICRFVLKKGRFWGWVAKICRFVLKKGPKWGWVAKKRRFVLKKGCFWGWVVFP